uniref:Capsid protein n=1 Tax=Finch associated genomovirus 2 TaxID=2576454 RepID=A0A4P8PKW4_9VIRU|nr:capsid protein [Finch associated genomovirus 2]
MAYRRSAVRRTSRRTRRSYGRTASRPRRTYSRKTYGRTKRRSYPRMTVRRILNKTSQKKSDTMMTWTNMRPDSSPGNTDFTPGPAELNGNPGTWSTMVFCPTARVSEDQQGVLGSKANTSMRTSATVFARGYRENLTLSTISGRGWQWRRICISMKGDTLNMGDNDPSTSPVFRETSQGYMRLITHGPAARVNDVLFKGTQNTDWQDVMTAPLDTRRIKVHSDKLYHIRSGNADGVTRHYKLWYPMNKNIYYEDDETGNEMQPSPFSVENNYGLGDYYIIDFFKSNRGNTDTDVLSIDATGRFYWHEK